MALLLGLEDRPSAVFAISDEMAFGALAAAHGLGIKTPDELAIIGVDGHYLAEIMDLTTIDQHVGEHGVVAARRLVDVLEGIADAPKRLQIESDLVLRGSA